MLATPCLSFVSFGWKRHLSIIHVTNPLLLLCHSVRVTNNRVDAGKPQRRRPKSERPFSVFPTDWSGSIMHAQILTDSGAALARITINLCAESWWTRNSFVVASCNLNLVIYSNTRIYGPQRSSRLEGKNYLSPICYWLLRKNAGI